MSEAVATHNYDGQDMHFGIVWDKLRDLEPIHPHTFKKAGKCAARDSTPIVTYILRRQRHSGDRLIHLYVTRLESLLVSFLPPCRYPKMSPSSQALPKE
jgi:hypothetical protein